jgi:amino acid adenylation domain-containing protein/non-ribosomal peptide synthase protein (TIGR01720 family)
VSLSDRISALNPAQRDLLELLRKKSGPRKPPALVARSGAGPWPLSMDQERLWFLFQLTPTDPSYNIGMVNRLRGALAPAVLARSLDDVVRRHEAWRTTFPSADGRPVQVVAPPAPLPLPLIDLSGLPESFRKAEAWRVETEAALQPFDLACGPLVRALLLRHAADVHDLSLRGHHIVTDGVSFGLFWQEMADLYPAFAAGLRPPLPDPPVQYADFAVWQREWLQGETLKAHEEFWIEQFRDAPPALELPTDRPRPAYPTTHGRRHPVRLAPRLAAGIKALAQRGRATPFMALLALYQALLGRLTGQERVVVGSPNVNRNRPELQGLLGLFISQISFVTDLSDDPPMDALVQRVRQVALGAFAHQDLPFGKVVEAVNPERDASRLPLVQVNLQLLDAQMKQETPRIPGTSIEPVPFGTETAPFELTLELWDLGNEMSGVLEYNTDLFDRSTIERWAEALEALIDGAVADPGTLLSRLPAQSAAARHQMLAEWNDTAIPGAGAPPALDLFAAQVESRPEAVAVAANDADSAGGDAEVTYAELARRAALLARTLRRLGVGREERVGLCAGRSADLVAGLLGIWQAGGAYVPLDPGYPADRLAFLAADAGIRVAVAPDGLRHRLPAGLEVVALPRPSGEEGTEDLAAPGRADLAYVLYTSGTTGQPKGVMVEHGNLASTLRASQLAFGWTADDRMLVLAPYSFDIFLFELLGPLLAGGTAELIPLAPALDLPRLLESLDRATRVHAVPALMRQIVDLARGAGRRYPGIRTVFVGGDAVPAELAADLPGVFPAAQVRILYGPTEGTIICAAHRAEASLPKVPRTLLGRPLPGVELRLAGRHGEPVPPGSVGEVWIGGGGVTRGYLGRPELTAERYLREAETDGARWYRTGDRARWLPDGVLEFLGRADQQVKVRGFRVEPGEIEAALAEHPAVREAVVLAREVPGGDKRLVAYVAARSEAAPAADELRRALAGRLPEHMIPGAFVLLPELPLTAHGKVDRRALARIEPEAAIGGSGGSGGSGAAPRTSVEVALAEIWRELLGLETVGVHDNFFRLGGDSILSIQLVARARRAGLVVTPRQIFENQTIAALAALPGLTAAVEEAAPEGPSTGTAPLAPIQRAFFADLPEEPWHFNQALLLEVRPPEVGPEIGPGVLERALAEVAAWHDALRLRFPNASNTLQATFQAEAATGAASSFPLVRIDLSALPEPAATLEGAAGAVQASLDLERGPLARAAWIDLGAERTPRLLLVLHHLIVDTVSWRILVEDLEAAGQAIAAGEPLPPPARTTSWKRWMERLAAHASTPEIQGELGYWLSRPPVAPLPLDAPAAVAANTVGATDQVAIELPAAATAALLREATRPYRSRPDELLLTALVRALARWTGAPRARIDLEGHGREEIGPGIDLSRTVGWFTTVHPLTLDLTGVDDPGAAVKAVKEQVRAVPGRGFGYGLLRHGDGAAAERLAAVPAAEIGFNYLGQVEAGRSGAAAFALAPEPAGEAQSPRARRHHLLDFDSLVIGDRLKTAWVFGPAHSRATVERLARDFITELEALVAHCLSPEAGGWTPSDFPLARLDQGTLDRVAFLRTAEIEDVYPLSPLQQGMLFHAALAPQAETYFEQLTCTITGDLDPAAFRRAWQRLVDRHAILRTTFLWEGLDEPHQAVHRSVPLPWHEEDWSSEPDPEGRLRAFATADRARGFDLARGPLLRAALLRTGAREHRFVWSAHHLLLDGWSLSPLFGEVFALYETARREGAGGGAGDGAPLPPPALPYRDFVAWLERRDRAADERHWREVMADFAGPTPLPFDRPGAPAGERATDFGQHVLTLPAAATAALETFARGFTDDKGLTVNTVIQAAWALLLSRWTGEPDVLFGAVTAGRPAELPGAETAIGLFINTLPVLLRVDSARPLGAWLAAVQEIQVASRQHDQTPLAAIRRWSGLDSGAPLFDSILVFENYPMDATLADRTGGLEISGLDIVERTNYPLSLAVVPGRELGLRITHDGRFEPATAQRLLGWLDRLLARIPAAVDLPTGALDLLSPEEQEEVLRAGIGSTPHGEAVDALSRFAAVASRTPDAPAVRDARGTLTFADLDRRSAALAGRLRSLGAGPETRVALAAGRSAGLLVGLLGIWRAGAAWVPLDPGHPRERLLAMLQDSGAVILVTDGSELPLGAEDVAHVLDLSSALEADGADLTAGPEERAAYVLYTSGSTGTPKGVVVGHRSLARYLEWVDDVLLAPVDWSIPAVTRLTFDASLKQLLAPLLAGRMVHLLPEEAATEPATLAEALAAEGFAALNCVPALWSAVLAAVESGEAPAPARLRRLFLGGEALSPALLERTRRALPGVEVWNLYGPTEATANATAARLTEEMETISLGRPLPGTRAWVLDREGRPVPPGGAGELCLAGAGLARGYLDLPGLTAERFVPDPFSGESGGRLYRTGDLVRRRSGGELEYRGRTDQQIKLRGIRLELGEVEAALRAHPDVREAAAGLRTDAGSSGSPRLIGWLVLREGAAFDPRALLAFLASRLPAAALPSALVPLAALPLTATGKLDRRALPTPEPEARPDADAAEAPGSAAEETLARVWADVLGVERVGLHEDFFRLGGDSIMTLQVVSRARRAGLRITPRQLFEHPTVAALAAVALVGGEDGPAARGAEQGLIEGEAPLTPIQRDFFSRQLHDPDWFDQAVLLETREGLGADTLRAAVAALLAHHDALRLRFGAKSLESAEQAPQHVPVSALDLSALPAEARAATLAGAADQVCASLDLARGPLLRAAFFDLGRDLGPGPGRLLLAIHHLVVDGVSWRVLLEDLETACLQILEGGPVRLPPKTSSWHSWAAALQAHAGSAEARAELPYWLDLARTPADPLPADHPADDDTIASAQVAGVSLTPEETQALLRDAPAAYRARVDDLLLAALARALSAWTGGRRFRVDLEGHGREEIVPGFDLSRTVGWFTALYPVVLEVPADAADGNPGGLLKAVKERLREVPGRGLGFGLLRWLADEETAARLAALPPAGVLFNYLGQLDRAAGGSGLLRPAAEPAGLTHAPSTPRTHPFVVNALVLEGRLQVSWGYGRRHAASTVERLAALFLTSLRELIAHCLAPGAGGLTPSDLPLAGLDQEAIEGVLEAEGRRGAIEDAYPLAPLQEGFLVHTLAAPGSEAYFEQLTVVIRGPLDPAAFREAWQQVFDRHPILRTAFLWEGLEEPLQAVHRRVEIPWVEEDWRGEPRPGERLTALATAERRRGLDLSRAPLSRMALFRTGEREHRFLWSFHHLLLDGWSLPPLLHELLSLYDAVRRGVPPPPPVQALSYRDFVAWLRERDPAGDEAFWRRELAGFDTPTPLPWDHPDASSERADEYGEETLDLTMEATDAVSAAARRLGVTPNTLFQGAWSLLLARWSGEDDVVFGSVVSGRPAELPGVETAVGLFINSVPVRVRIDPSRPVAEWLTDLRRRQGERQPHEHAPLSRVQRWSDAPVGAALFHSLVVFENYPVGDIPAEAAEGLDLVESHITERTHYPLSCAAMPGTALRFLLTHDRRFEPATARRLLEQTARLLTGLAALTADTDRPVGAVEILGPEETAQIQAWSGGAPPPPTPGLVHLLVTAQAAARPEATALLWSGGRWTYGELAAFADRLARRLRRLGVAPETVVGICLERTPERVGALLGALVSGGVYLPLDPALPRARREELLRGSRAAVLVTTRELAGAGGWPAPETLLLDSGFDDQEPDGPLAEAAYPESPAYIIYTSGSTGAPKGVVVPHSAIAAHVETMRQILRLTAEDRTMHMVAPGFDLSVEQILTPLAAGATVMLPEGLESPSALIAALPAPVTLVNVVAAYWAEWAREIADGATLPPSLHTVLTGGEAMAVDAARHWLARPTTAGVRMINSYGPTEAVITSSLIDVVAGKEGNGPAVPIGYPFAGRSNWILDRDGRPVPPGAPGELYLGGVLARGYLGRPDLTAERFVPDPWGEPGSRLYRTGDLTRYRGDGAIDFLGRTDHQFKIRGVRIEPGEVEAALRAHPAVRDAAVVLAGERLVAWVVGASGIDRAELPAFLAARLHAAAVPTLIEEIPALPLTPSGKIDRRALAERRPERAEPARPYLPPANAVEEQLADLWRELLGVGQVSRDDNFFALGGHSLLATRLAGRIRKHLGVAVPLRALFEAADLAALAREVLALRLRAEAPGELAGLMAELDGLSEEEALALLAEDDEEEEHAG